MADKKVVFFHGYYGGYCYLPLYIFAGAHLLCARQRRSGQDAAAGSLAEVERIVKQLRTHWSDVRIVVRADSGFCREELLAWCEANGVDYVLGLARNERLRALSEEARYPLRTQKSHKIYYLCEITLVWVRLDHEVLGRAIHELIARSQVDGVL